MLPSISLKMHLLSTGAFSYENICLIHMKARRILHEEEQNLMTKNKLLLGSRQVQGEVPTNIYAQSSNCRRSPSTFNPKAFASDQQLKIIYIYIYIYFVRNTRRFVLYFIMKEYTSVHLYKRHMYAVQVSICSTVMCVIQVI